MSKGAGCAGWLYVPEDLPADGRAPAIVMANALTSVKEVYLSNYAERFVEAGFVTLAFDYRFLGASEGEPRGQILAHEQHEDIRNALTWLGLQPEVDPERIGAWGVSLGGGHVIHLGAFDRRIKAVVATVPAVDNYGAFLQMMGPAGLGEFLRGMAQARIAAYQTGQVFSMKVVSNTDEPAMIPGPEAYEFYAGAAESIAPSWLNRVTMESIEKSVEYRPALVIDLVSPTPLLMVVAEDDHFLPANLARAAFERAGEPKRLEMLACGHTEIYNQDPWLSRSVGAAVEWFQRYLRG
jgi:fermentation-respiration switch protein FrsA (DUF1100 family)